MKRVVLSVLVVLVGLAVALVPSGQAGAGGFAVTTLDPLPALTPDHADTDAVCLIQSFYGLAIRLAQRRGVDVDLPRHLQKITRTR